MKKIIALILALVCLMTFIGCADEASKSGNGNDTAPATLNNDTGNDSGNGGSPVIDDGTGNVRLTFAESVDMSTINKLAGRTVEIIGYMATVSPVSGKDM